MDMDKMIERINFLYKKSKEIGELIKDLPSDLKNKIDKLIQGVI